MAQQTSRTVVGLPGATWPERTIYSVSILNNSAPWAVGRYEESLFPASEYRRMLCKAVVPGRPLSQIGNSRRKNTVFSK